MVLGLLAFYIEKNVLDPYLVPTKKLIPNAWKVEQWKCFLLEESIRRPWSSQRFPKGTGKPLTLKEKEI